VQCWGDNSSGQLGDGTRSSSASPVNVVGLRAAAVAVTAGASHSCALLGDGTIQCWGHTLHNQLGDGTGSDSTTPVNVRAVVDATAVSAGYGQTCALTEEGTVLCWGTGYGDLPTPVSGF
jgi:alpha-tubulin suppressor-like RCC1 family protein